MGEQQENALEVALRLAANEPARRPDFYRTLLDATVYIIAQSEHATEGGGLIPAGEKISIQNWTKNDGALVIPFFTSLDALRSAIEHEVKYMALSVRSLFELTRGASLVLNPKLPYSKEFLPHEVQTLLTRGVNRIPEKHVMQATTRVFLGQPAHYPVQMIDSLTALLSGYANVKAAYLVLMHDPTHDDKPHLVIGIDAEGDAQGVIHAAGVVVGDTVPDGEIVDLMRITHGEKGLSAYLLQEVKPFYEREWGSKLMGFLDPGRA